MMEEGKREGKEEIMEEAKREGKQKSMQEGKKEGGNLGRSRIGNW